MKLTLPLHIVNEFSTRRSAARILGEMWFGAELSCPFCRSRMVAFPPSHPASDFVCYNKKCGEEFQLKSKTTPVTQPKAPAGSYKAIQGKLASSKHPSLVLLQYDSTLRKVIHVRFIYRGAITKSAIKKRPKDLPGRPGYRMFDYDLTKIPRLAAVDLINPAATIPLQIFRERWQKVKNIFLRDDWRETWTVRVAAVIQRLRRTQFTNADIYKYGERFGDYFPQNKTVEHQIRKQLQVIESLGVIKRVREGVYEKVS